MGKAYDVSSGKYEVAKKAFVVEGSKYVKLPKAFVVEGGKYVKLWSGVATDIAVALNGIFDFLYFDDYSKAQSKEIASSNFSAITGGFNHWQKHIFKCNGGTISYLCEVRSDGTLNVVNVGTGGTTIGKFCLDGVGDKVWSHYYLHNALGGGQSGQGGYVLFNLHRWSEDMSLSTTTLYGYPPDQYEQLSWADSYDGSSSSSSRYAFSNIVAHEGKLYFVKERRYSYSSAVGTDSTYECDLISFDPSTSKKTVELTRFINKSGSGNNVPNVNTTLLNFGGTFIFVSGAEIYKIANGTCTKLLTDIVYNGVFKVNETDFIAYTTGNLTGKVYRFANGNITVVKTITLPIASTNVAVKQGVILYSYTNKSDNKTVLQYSLDCGTTWTKNVLSLKTDPSSSISSATVHHYITSDFC